ncbi:MAG: alpha-amylase family glycosyl hydrolase [Bacilli bacterium]|nr:alpha-amylase family glycosyl hydrolase [Bacilli bacterium]
MRFSQFKKLGLLGMAIAILSGCVPTASDISLSENPTSSEEPFINNLNGGVYYEIFVRAFADSDNDDVGDFNGITGKLEYLQDMGFSDLWLMPINPSPSYHGYDVIDYQAVNSDYGTMADFENLVLEAKNHNINIIIDWVLNHTSSAHPWFLASAEQVTSGRALNPGETDYRDYYNWIYGEKPAYYTEYQSTNWFYEENFQGGGMPDLNLENQEVVDLLFESAAFWLEKGVNGFRLDAVKYCFENTEKDVAFLGAFKDYVKAINPDAFIVAEDWSPEAHMLAYYTSGIDAFFAFDGSLPDGKIAYSVINGYGQNLASYITSLYEKIKQKNSNGYVSLFLSNHDQNRIGGMQPVGSTLGLNYAKAMASSYLLSPGHPFVYYGEEISLRGSGSDQNKRLPMLWGRGDNRVYETAPVEGSNYPLDAQVRVGAFDALEDPWSLTSHYRNVLRMRNKYQIFSDGVPNVLPLENTHLMGLTFTHQDSELFPNTVHVIHNFYDLAIKFTTDYQVVDEIRANDTTPVTIGVTGEVTIAPYSTLILQS